jgi:hypothetical protein
MEEPKTSIVANVYKDCVAIEAMKRNFKKWLFFNS